MEPFVRRGLVTIIKKFATKENHVNSFLKAGLLTLALVAAPIAAQAGTLEGVAIGAGAGAVVAGPPGAVVGGVVGAVTGGPNIVNRRHRHCWTGNDGFRHCSWRR